MGTFYTKCIIENHIKRTKSVSIPKILVDTGSEYTWIPGETLHKIGVIREKKDLAFNGEEFQTGSATVSVVTIDEVVFGEEGDMVLLGTRTLEGLNLTVDSRLKKLVASGPLPVAYVG
ncbi:MAG: hypothetical protein HZB37_02955 [Planctomycetes bacterium]|nr:hypothetical protein [Planctomycetota bacterium]